MPVSSAPFQNSSGNVGLIISASSVAGLNRAVAWLPFGRESGDRTASLTARARGSFLPVKASRRAKRRQSLVVKMCLHSLITLTVSALTDGVCGEAKEDGAAFSATPLLMMAH